MVKIILCALFVLCLVVDIYCLKLDQCPPGYRCQKKVVKHRFIRSVDSPIEEELELDVCPPGTYSPDGANECMPCEFGTFATYSGAPSCCACPIGHMCPENNMEPEPCPVGTYNNLTRQTCCHSCPPGKFAVFKGMSQCLNCPSGYKCAAKPKLACEEKGVATESTSTRSTTTSATVSVTTEVLLPLQGTTVISNIPDRPSQISIGVDGYLYVVVEANDNKVRRYTLNDPVVSSIVAGQGGFGHFADNQLSYPIALFVDDSSNVYVAHGTRYYVMLWKKNAETGIKIAGDGSYASNAYYGLAVDSKGNIYASDCDNHRVIKFAPFATNGTILIGTGTRGNDSQSLNCPSGLYLDELNSHLYVSDTQNHRIQRYTLDSSSRIITVAGGKGAGLDADQLKSPRAICMSKKTGALYIADGGNSRVQKWNPGATFGLTVAGTGTHGNGATQLYVASGVALSLDETFLYVGDSLNKRIQRFPLI